MVGFGFPSQTIWSIRGALGYPILLAGLATVSAIPFVGDVGKSGLKVAKMVPLVGTVTDGALATGGGTAAILVGLWATKVVTY